jgi:hypothetical protein
MHALRGGRLDFVPQSSVLIVGEHSLTVWQRLGRGWRSSVVGCAFCKDYSESGEEVFGGQEEEEEEGEGEGRVSETLLFVSRLRACVGAVYR